MRSGQSALEYLTTYGWAFIGILVMFGTLMYFGVLSPSKYIPEQCEFGAQLACEDYALERISDTEVQLSFILANRFSKDISIEEITPLEDYAISGCAMPIVISKGKTETIQCVIDADWPAGEKVSVPLAFSIKNDESASAALHNVTGELFATVTS